MSQSEAKKKRFEVELGEVNEKNIGQLKLINSVVFPVKYNDQFYRGLLKSYSTPEAAELIRLAYYNDVPVGAVACRLEPNPDKVTQKLYIMTLGVLAPYRHAGIGTQLLNYVLKLVEPRKDVVSDVYLHVQTSNDTAIDFYKRNGFEIVGKLEKYYKKIEPPDCFVLRKVINADASAKAPLLPPTPPAEGSA